MAEDSRLDVPGTLAEQATESAPEDTPQQTDGCPRVTVVVPAYNEEGAIAEDMRSLLEVLGATDLRFEVVVVNDGSKDRTEEEARKVPGLRLLSHSHNRGYGAALKTGIRAARGEVIVITDADGTYPPRYIPELVGAIEAGSDMAVGARTGKGAQIPSIRKPAKWFLAKLANYLAGRQIPDLNSGQRAFRKADVVKFFPILPSGFSFTTTITLAMMCNDYEVTYHPIEYLHRIGTSKIRPIRDTYNFIVLIVRTICYFNPLKVFIPPALFMVLVGFAKIGHGIVIGHDLGHGWAKWFLAAVQMAGIGAVADMVAKLVGSREIKS
jgi:glycosyltransferase involved in cell wall biosynthesis